MRPGILGCAFLTASEKFRKLICVFGVVLSFPSDGQNLCPDPTDSLSEKTPAKRFVWVGTSQGVLLATSLAALNHYWYSGYPRADFHFANDFKQWNNMDKAGHMWSAYTLAKTSAVSWKWAGMNTAKADLLGVSTALAYQTVIEIADGFSSKWGFSWGDFGANLSGAALYTVQQRIWKEQKFQLKVMAFKPYRYPAELEERTSELFGKSLPDKLLSDYNIQSYWLGTSFRTFSRDLNIPPWLGVAVGYGSEMMLGETSNRWQTSGGVLVSRTDIARQRRFFLALDLDLTKIKTRSKLLKSVFQIVNSVKIPSPTLEYRGGKVHGHLLMLN
jgi:hypothetical protein